VRLPWPTHSIIKGYKRGSLVLLADQVVGELLDRVGGGTRLDRLRVVGDEDGLDRLDNDDALTALGWLEFGVSRRS
jgi:hypothetical protein